MTRINLVDPAILTDKHLLAEYKEITRPFNKMVKRIEKGNTKFEIPPTYVLGAGHETFFFDKLGWLFHRYELIYNELLHRDFNIDRDKYKEIRMDLWKKLRYTEFWNLGYEPTPEEIYLNMSRLCIRSQLEPVMDEIRSWEL